jgi:hypothetical protein
MEHFRLLAFLAVCFAAAARADPEPITTPFIPCKVLPALKVLNLQQVRDFFLNLIQICFQQLNFFSCSVSNYEKWGFFFFIALLKVFYAPA